MFTFMGRRCYSESRNTSFLCCSLPRDKLFCVQFSRNHLVSQLRDLSEVLVVFFWRNEETTSSTNINEKLRKFCSVEDSSSFYHRRVCDVWIDKISKFTGRIWDNFFGFLWSRRSEEQFLKFTQLKVHWKPRQKMEKILKGRTFW